MRSLTEPRGGTDSLFDLSYDPKKRWKAVIENATLRGDLSIAPMAFPVVRRGQHTEWVSFDWGVINKIQKNIMDYGVDNKLVKQQIAALLTHNDLTPYDIKMLMETLLTPTQHMLFLQKWEERLDMARLENITTLPPADPLATATMDMYMGKGQFADPQRQARLHARIREQSQRIAIRVFESLPQLGKVHPPYTKIMQGLQEPFMQFVDKIKEAVDRAPDLQGDMKAIMVKEIALQNANPNCKRLLSQLPAGASLVEMVERCARETLEWEQEKAQIHGVALAAALRQGQNTPAKKSQPGPCYGCGQSGHIRRYCVNKESPPQPGPGSAPPPSRICERCGKFGHGAPECRSKYHKNGSPLSGNLQLRGMGAENKYPSPAQTQVYPQTYPMAASTTCQPQPVGQQAWTWQPPQPLP